MARGSNAALRNASAPWVAAIAESRTPGPRRPSRGTRVVVIAGMRWSLLSFRRELLEAMVEAGCEVTAMAPGLAGSDVAQALTPLGVRSVSFAMERHGTSPGGDLRTCADLVRQLKMVGPDKVLSYTLKPVIYGSIAARIAGVPEAYSLITGLGYTFVRGSRRQRLLEEIVVVLSRLAVRQNEVVLFQNPDDLALFRDRRIIARGQKAIVVDGSGVNLDWFSFQPVTAGVPTFLLMARLIEAKGIREYAEAAAVLKRRYPFARFQLLGAPEKGPAAISSEQLDAWERDADLEVLDFTRDVRPLLAGCTVLVLPSYREGTPRSVLEALATGRAVITTDTPGCRETVVDGENGFLIAPRNVPGLVEAMERFIREPTLAEKMGAASRRRAESKYDVHRVNRAMLDAMELS